MEGSLIVAIAAAVVSGLSLILSLWYAHRADGRADEQADRDSKRLVMEEQRYKQEREQDEQEKIKAAEEQRALLSAKYVSGPSETDGGYEYQFRVVNVGHRPARWVTGWLADDKGVKADGAGAVSDVLESGEKAQLRVFTRALDDPLELHLEWDEDDEHNEKVSRAQVPLHV